METISGATHSSTVDRYLETIFYIASEEAVVRPSRISAWLAVSAPTVSEALQRLERDQWISIRADRSVTLTAQGEVVASAIVRRHRVLERWLTDVLGFDWAAADLEAERIASAISDEVIDRIDVSMGTPLTCPHGNAIPGRVPTYGALISLEQIALDTPARVRRISEVGEHEGQLLLLELARHGIGEDCEVEVLTRSLDGGTLKVAGGRSVLTFDATAARAIWVEREDALFARSSS